MKQKHKIMLSVILGLACFAVFVFTHEAAANFSFFPNQKLTARGQAAFKPKDPSPTKFVKEIANGQEQTYFSDVKQTPDGGYVAVGYTRIGTSNIDGMIVKFDKNGKIEWKKTINTAGTSYDYFNKVRIAPDGNFLILGNEVKRWLLKFAPNGDLITHKVFYSNGSGPDIDNVLVTDTGSIIVNGDSGSGEAYFAQLDPDTFDVIWERLYFPSGGANEQLTDIIQTQDGNYLGLGLLGDGGEQILIIKIGNFGDLIFSKTIESPVPLHKFQGNSIIELGNGDLMIVGVLWIQTPLQAHGIALRVDSSGNLLWIKQYQADGGNSIFDQVVQIEPGILMIEGHANAEAVVVRMDEDGNILSSTIYPMDAAASGSSISKTTDGGAIVGTQRALIKVDETGDAGENCEQAPEVVWAITTPDSQEFSVGSTVVLPSQFNDATQTKQPNVTQKDIFINEHDVCGD